MFRVCKVVDSTAKHELEASTFKLPIEGHRAVFCANLVDPKILQIKQHKIILPAGVTKPARE